MSPSSMTQLAVMRKHSQFYSSPPSPHSLGVNMSPSSEYCACTPRSLVHPGGVRGFLDPNQRVSVEQLEKNDREWHEQRCTGEHRRQGDSYSENQYAVTKGTRESEGDVVNGGPHAAHVTNAERHTGSRRGSIFGNLRKPKQDGRSSSTFNSDVTLHRVASKT
jgi:hypothetical protein